MRRPALLAVALTVAAAAPAHAAAPIDLGPGRIPHVAGDATGAGYVTWSESASNDVAHYCTLPSGATTCVNTFSPQYPAGSSYGLDSGIWPLVPGDGRVLVIDARCCTNYASKFLYISINGGMSFDSGTEVGDDDNSGAGITGGAIYTPANTLARPAESILTFTDQATLGLSFQANGLIGPPTSTSPTNVITQGDATSGSIGVSGQTLVAAWYALDDGTVYWRKWSGAGDVNDSSNWGPITPLEVASINASPRLAYGAGGVFIAYNQGPSGGPLKTVVRRFNGNGWDPPNTLADPGASWFDLTEGPCGNLHFVYEADDGSLQYRFGTTAGDSNFSSSQTLLPGGGADLIGLRLAVNSNGWATWEAAGHVVALEITPSALQPPTQGSTVNAVPVTGKVRVRLPAGAARHAKDGWTRAAAAGFVPLESLGRQIPVGSRLDTTKGTVRLFSAVNNAGKQQHGDFSRGLFDISQGRKSPLTTVSMTGGGLKACGVKLPRGGSPKRDAGATAARKHRRSLFSDVKGRFRTRGRNSTATVRGTQFTVTDSCKGTLTRVKKGSVKVRDLWRKRNVIVKAGRSYLARRGNR